jgi:hypothetical protein
LGKRHKCGKVRSGYKVAEQLLKKTRPKPILDSKVKTVISFKMNNYNGRRLMGSLSIVKIG